MDVLLADATRPFGVAALILAGLVLIEVGALVVGLSLSDIVEKGFDHHHPAGEAEGPLGGVLHWINAGGVPIIVLLMLLLGSFAAIGYLMQSVAGLLWAPLPVLPASIAAAVVALPLARRGTRAVARIVPRDESYVVEDADFVGRVAEVTIGPLDQGRPGKVKLRDRHGNWHFPAARAADGHGPFPSGAFVLLADRQGAVFLAVSPPDDLQPGR